MVYEFISLASVRYQWGVKTTGLFETLKKNLKDYLEAKKLNLWECLFILDLTELVLFEICEEILSRIMK